MECERRQIRHVVAIIQFAFNNIQAGRGHPAGTEQTLREPSFSLDLCTCELRALLLEQEDRKFIQLINFQSIFYRDARRQIDEAVEVRMKNVAADAEEIIFPAERGFDIRAFLLVE